MADRVRVGDVVRVIAGKTKDRVGMVHSVAISGAATVLFVKSDGDRESMRYRPEKLEVMFSQPERDDG